MSKILNKIFLIKSRLAIASLLFLFLSINAVAFLPNGKMQNYSFKEQTAVHNYIISGPIGYVSIVNNLFSAEKAVIKVYDRSSQNLNESSFKKEILCNELTYELNNSYILCIQDSKYLSIDLKNDKAGI
jgi:hypothetical protein